MCIEKKHGIRSSISMCPWLASPGPYLLVARSPGSGRVRYKLVIHDVLQYSFYIRLQLYFSLYLGPMFLWASTQTDLRGTNVMGLGWHTLISSPRDSIWIADSGQISNLQIFDWINLQLLYFTFFINILYFEISMGILGNKPGVADGSGNQLIA
jgi:hypothetical protein